MKKIFLSLILFSSIYSYAQQNKNNKTTAISKPKEIVVVKQKTLLLDEDIQVIKHRYSVMDLEFYLPDMDKNLQKVYLSFACDSINYKELGINANKLNEMIIKSNLETMLTIKNKYTYVPKKINLVYDPKEYKWTSVLYFTAQNDFGATKDGFVINSFDGLGKHLETY